MPAGFESGSWLPANLAICSQKRVVVALAASALAIRLYLSLTSYCIASDGIEYIRMAQEFAAGRPERALASVFSPLYPWLIALAHPIISSWELTGDLISVLFGTATVPLIYYLVKEVHDDHALAIGASALTMIHPALAEYSASVRTEAGYICLLVAAIYLFVSGAGSRRPFRIFIAGAVAGVAYLYRAEAIGLLILTPLFLVATALISREWRLDEAGARALLFAIPFLLIASPYLLYLHHNTGHWTVSKELNVAAAASVMELVKDNGAWRALAISGNTSLLAAFFTNPYQYAGKVAYDLVMSFYYFAVACGLLPFGCLLAGLWMAGLAIFRAWRQALLAALVAFYFFGFSLFNTGPRFMVHLIPFTFGWMMVGLAAASGFANARFPGFGRLPRSLLAWLLAFTLIPTALIPIGYDLRGFRYVAADLANADPRPAAIIARDRRAAFYAGVDFVELPFVPPDGDPCGWLQRQERASYLLFSRHDERRWSAVRGQNCVSFIKRYPRGGDGYFDLFVLRR